jgi:hypothetical protein
MNIFEIVSLNENVERVPGQNMWRVIYPDEMGRTPDIMPTQEKAQARYDQEVERWRSTSAERQRQEREANQQRARNARERAKEAAQRAKRDTETPQARRETRQRWLRRFSRISRIGGAGGLVVVSSQMWETAMDQMMRNYRSYATGAYGDISLNANGELNNPLEADLAFQSYSIAQERYFGAWAATVVLPALIIELRLLFATVRQGMRFIRWIRGINIATTAATAAGGPTIVAGIIKFILVEGAMWAVLLYLMNSESARRWIANIVVTNWLGAQISEAATDILQLHANALSGIVSTIGDAMEWDTQEIQNNLSDVQDLAGLSDADARDRVLQTDAAQGGQTPHGEFRGVDNPDAVSPTTTSGSNPLRTPGMN